MKILVSGAGLVVRDRVGGNEEGSVAKPPGKLLVGSWPGKTSPAFKELLCRIDGGGAEGGVEVKLLAGNKLGIDALSRGRHFWKIFSSPLNVHGGKDLADAAYEIRLTCGGLSPKPEYVDLASRFAVRKDFMDGSKGIPVVNSVYCLEAVFGSGVRINRVILTELSQGYLRQLLNDIWCLDMKHGIPQSLQLWHEICTVKVIVISIIFFFEVSDEFFH